MTDINDEDEVAKLLGKAGTKMEPDSDKMKSARSAFLQSWDSEFKVDPDQGKNEPTHTAEVREIASARKIPMRWQLGSGIAAALLLSALVLVLNGGPQALFGEGAATPQSYYATLESMTGQALADNVELARNDSSSNQLQPGVEIETGNRSYLRIRLANNASLRVDEKTRLVLTHTGLDLRLGRVYIDAPNGAKPTIIVAGELAVTDIGTQFEVVRQQDAVQVSVREGAIEISDAQSPTAKRPLKGKALSSAAQPGIAKSLTIENGEVIEEREIDTDDSYWHWVHQAPYEVELQSVAQLLELASRELGLQLQYKSEAVLMASRSTPLSGKIQLDETLSDQIPEILAAASFQQLDSPENILLVDFKR